MTDSETPALANSFRAQPVLRPEQLRALQIGMVIAIGVAVVFVIALTLAGDTGGPAVPQHDTLMFMQYALAIAEGHPYSYHPDDKASTGSTSHLYPVVLSVFYRIGFRGERLYLASLALNAVLYVSVVVLGGLMAAALAPRLMWLAMVLIALNGPVLLGFFGQTDMGLFAVCALGTWVTLLYKRPLLAAAAITAAVWTRPEGVLSAIAWLVFGIVWHLRTRHGAAWWLVGFWGCVQFALVLAWNRWLTGMTLFHSLVGKGYWAAPWGIEVLQRVVADFARLVSGVVFNLPSAAYLDRTLYSLPFVSGVLALIGVIRCCRDNGESGKRRDVMCMVRCALATTIIGALAVVALSGWQGYFYDRHIAWIFPFLAVLTAAGVNALYEKRLRSPRTTRAPLLTRILVGYSALTLPVFIAALCGSASTTTSQAQFAQRAVFTVRPDGGRVGVLNYPGLAYVLPQHRFIHLGGYISPRFVGLRDVTVAVEILAHEPEHRFDLWLVSQMERQHPTLSRIFGPMLDAETDVFPADIRLALYRADWRVLEESKRPRTSGAVENVANWSLSDELDVGYDAAERAHSYLVWESERDRSITPGLAVWSAGDGPCADVGRAVLGAESFQLNAHTGTPAKLVWRTASALTANVHYRGRVQPYQAIALDPETVVRIKIGDRELARWKVAAAPMNGFAEPVFEIPAEWVTENPLTITVEGDHISFAWWLYQALP